MCCCVCYSLLPGFDKAGVPLAGCRLNCYQDCYGRFPKRCGTLIPELAFCGPSGQSCNLVGVHTLRGTGFPPSP